VHYRILYNRKLIVQLGFSLIDLASFCIGTIHKSEAFLAEFADDFDPDQDVDLASQY
jgi:hypothetical protein